MPSPAKTTPLRLGTHHFAYLRSIAEGLDQHDVAMRYLGLSHASQIRLARIRVIDAVRSLMRHAGQGAWRLIGISLRERDDASGERPPTLEEFACQQGLEDWPQDELLGFYLEAWPVDAQARRRQKVRQRLRERVIRCMADIELKFAATPKPADAVHLWFDPVSADRLLRAGMCSLDDLRRRVAAGGRWWSGMPSVGEKRAGRLRDHLQVLLPDQPLAVHRFPATVARCLMPLDQQGPPQTGDWAQCSDWIRARAGSAHTAALYLREARRLILWLQQENAGRRLHEMTPQDCRLYISFLQNLPPHWISRRSAAPGADGWAPFRGPLSPASVRQSLSIIAAMFRWMHESGSVPRNPWLLVNRTVADSLSDPVRLSRALPEALVEHAISFCSDRLPDPAAARMLFLLRFMTSVGLRSAELLAARLDHVIRYDGAWMLRVLGKGARSRVVALPGMALHALEQYLLARGLPLPGSTIMPPDTPVLASLTDPAQPPGYTALYEHVKSWLRAVIRTADLPVEERMRLQAASTHWLRHTFGTTAMARRVPVDVIQAQLGHASSQTTTATYGRSPLQRQATELDAVFGETSTGASLAAGS